MRPKTRKVLRDLSTAETKASLIAFWEDVRKLSREEFVSALEAFERDKRSRSSRPRKSRSFPRDDKPLTQIAFLLKAERRMTDGDAQVALSSMLKERGYRTFPDEQKNLNTGLNVSCELFRLRR